MIAPLRCLTSGPVQIAYCVTDLQTAVAAWTAAGAGPFVVREHIDVTDVMIFGESAVFDHSSAYGWWGELMVELVQVHQPSTLAVQGLHHMAWFVDSFDDAAAELHAAGLQPALTARAGSTRFGFYDGRDTLGHFVEIYEGSDTLRSFYAHVRDLSGRR